MVESKLARLGAGVTRAGVLLLAGVMASASGKASVGSAIPPAAVAVEMGGGAKMEFVLIPAGSFVMGSEPNFADGDEIPQHQVTISRPFYLGKYEVTQQQWTAVMGANPSQFKGPSLPVENVSWNDGQVFLTRASAKTGRRFALPTEAQWEYACRAGTSTRWYYGETEDADADHGWITTNAGGRTHPVGAKPASPWGLYDLYGNVWEWCADWYANPYPKGDSVDPTGPTSGAARVLRGGAWGDEANVARSAYRNSMGPDQHNGGTGFRCVLLIAEDALTAP